MAKKKTGIGIQSLFEEPTVNKANKKQSQKMPETVITSGFNLDSEAMANLEAAQNFISWLIGQDVSQQLIVEVALKVALEELDAKGKDSRLATEIAGIFEAEN